MAFLDKKSQVIVRQATDLLTLRLATPSVATTLAVASGFDASGNPQITVGPGTSDSDSAFVRVIPFPVDPVGVAVDALGLTPTSYGPHIVQLVLEQRVAAPAGGAVMSAASFVMLLGTLALFGGRVDLYLTAHGTAPTVAGITGTPVASFDNTQFPGMLTA